MRFRTQRRHVPYLNRRDQLRMLSMLGLLMLVVIGMRWAARPSSWYWLTGRPDAARPNADSVARTRLDFSVKAVDDIAELRPGEFIVPGPQQGQKAPIPTADGNDGKAKRAVADAGASAADGAGADDGQKAVRPSDVAGPQPNGGTESTAGASEGAKPPEGTPADSDGKAAVGPSEQAHMRVPSLDALATNLKIPPGLLAEIEDRTLGVLKKEKLAHDWILAAVREVPAGRLEKAARRDVGFVALMTHPEDFRGELIRVDGLLGRVARFDAGPNDFGLKQLYEAYILTHESPENPVRFVCTSVPRDLLPPQQGLREFDRNPPRVTAVGYFFKLYGYQARKGPHVAPLILGARLVWHRPQPVEEVASSALYWFLGFVGAILLVLGVVMWQFHRSDRQFQQSHLKRFQEPPEMLSADTGAEAQAAPPTPPADETTPASSGGAPDADKRSNPPDDDSPPA